MMTKSGGVLNEAPLFLVGGIQQRRVLCDGPARVRFESLKLHQFFDFGRGDGAAQSPLPS
jgi:hypothetical protein